MHSCDVNVHSRAHGSRSVEAHEGRMLQGGITETEVAEVAIDDNRNNNKTEAAWMLQPVTPANSDDACQAPSVELSTEAQCRPNETSGAHCEKHKTKKEDRRRKRRRSRRHCKRPHARLPSQRRHSSPPSKGWHSSPPSGRRHSRRRLARQDRYMRRNLKAKKARDTETKEKFEGSE